MSNPSQNQNPKLLHHLLSVKDSADFNCAIADAMEVLQAATMEDNIPAADFKILEKEFTKLNKIYKLFNGTDCDVN